MLFVFDSFIRGPVAEKPNEGLYFVDKETKATGRATSINRLF